MYHMKRFLLVLFSSARVLLQRGGRAVRLARRTDARLDWMLVSTKIFWTCLLLATAGLAGCASPGVPKPPSLHLPEKVTDLQAERVGAEVRLTWTTPANTTDGEAIRTVSTAVVCRSAGRVAACVPVRQLPVTPGQAEAEDALPGTLRVGADSVVEYRVELKNGRGRSAGASEPVFAAGGRAPEMPVGVAASSRREGVLVTWEPDTGGAAGVMMELHRTGPEGAAGAAKGVAPAAKPARKARAGPAFTDNKSPAGQVTMMADSAGQRNGMVDRSARDGEAYTYVAQRVRSVKVAGRTLEMRSAPSAPVKVIYRNTFAPQAPSGLACVPGGGFGAAPSIDLSWEPNGEVDLAGYKVYRTVDGGAAALLTEKLLPGPAYRDLGVSAGHTYGYRVTAVDAHRNESAASAEVQERLR